MSIYMFQDECHSTVLTNKDHEDDTTISKAIRKLKECLPGLSQPLLDGSKLESIAKARFGLSVAADWLHRVICKRYKENWLLQDLFSGTGMICTLKGTNWPRYVNPNIVGNNQLG